MAFWIAAAFLTFGACLAIILPAMRARAAAPAAAHDIAVYRDQLAEVSRDAGRGLIGASEAEEAKAEIGRRILRTGEADSAGTASRPVPRLSRALTAAAILAVPLVSWGMYSMLGSPGLPSQPLTARVSVDPAESSVEDLVARAEAHLAANPDDGRGWDVLAPIYVRLDRGDDAVAAYRNAIRLEGATAAREAGLGEALATAARRVTPEARAAFERALALEPRQPKAAFYMASALAQDGRFAEAAAAWRTLLPSLAADSPWRQPTEQAIAEAEQRAGTAAPGPTQDDVAAAQDMTPEDRLAMVQGMVAQLDAKLRENPKDAEGWRRLVRSYMVLGQESQARDALARGVAAFGAGTTEAAALTDFAQALGLPATDTN
ncbi:MAG: c-type cytochrome biogenesis protein CcmI [Rhizobiaceae bacterium]